TRLAGRLERRRELRRAACCLLKRRSERASAVDRDVGVLAGDPLRGRLQHLAGLRDESPALLDPPALRGVTEECATLCVARGDGGWELLSDARGGVETAVEQADDTGEPGHRLVAATVRGARVCRTGVAIVATARGPDHTRRPGQRGGRGSGRRSEG